MSRLFIKAKSNCHGSTNWWINQSDVDSSIFCCQNLRFGSEYASDFVLIRFLWFNESSYWPKRANKKFGYLLHTNLMDLCAKWKLLVVWFYFLNFLFLLRIFLGHIFWYGVIRFRKTVNLTSFVIKSICESLLTKWAYKKTMLRENTKFCNKQTIKKEREIPFDNAESTLAKTLTR